MLYFKIVNYFTLIFCLILANGVMISIALWRKGLYTVDIKGATSPRSAHAIGQCRTERPPAEVICGMLALSAGSFHILLHQRERCRHRDSWPNIIAPIDLTWLCSIDMLFQNIFVIVQSYILTGYNKIAY